jgi:hypothetical protein
MQDLLLLSPFCPHPIQDKKKIINPTELHAVFYLVYLFLKTNLKMPTMCYSSQQILPIRLNTQVIHASDSNKNDQT